MIYRVLLSFIKKKADDSLNKKISTIIKMVNRFLSENDKLKLFTQNELEIIRSVQRALHIIDGFLKQGKLQAFVSYTSRFLKNDAEIIEAYFKYWKKSLEKLSDLNKIIYVRAILIGSKEVFDDLLNTVESKL